MSRSLRPLTCALAMILSTSTFPGLTEVLADEGMWLFSQPPTRQLMERYGFQPTAQWLEHLQKSAVRFNSGGSGSFVSADGLVMTNHHVGADCLHKLSTPERDLLATGFHARGREEELKCVDLELNVLMEIIDVTDKVNSAVKPGMDSAAAQQARRAVSNTIEKESFDATGLRSDVVTLFQGGRYNLYRYKKYTDVRLVFAPEQEIAFFGGDPDNFEFPRFDLDICFFRVYEDGKPIRREHYLKWSRSGAVDEELVFVAGHPGRTDRLNTVAHLEFLRDVVFPNTLNTLRRREVLLRTFSDRGLENARRAKDELFGYQNSRKARLGGLAGLQDPAIMEAKRNSEEHLRQAVAADPALKDAQSAWDDVAAALRVWSQIYPDYELYERGMAFNSELYAIARGLVRLAEETTKPNTERLREFAEAGLDSLKQQLFSEAPIYPDLEKIKLADSLGYLIERAGAENPFVKQLLAKMSPQARSAQLVAGTGLADVAFRRKLADGGRSAIESSDDPLIALARTVDGPARQVRKTYEERVDEPLRQAYAKIAKARFAVEGESTYPDATFTLRLAYGQVKGYEQQGQSVPAWTTLGGAFQHAAEHGNVAPFLLPTSWQKHRQQLDPDTPFNFVCTADIIGGNSGSPVVNRAGEVVGIIFDGNIQSLVLNFVYTDRQARAVSVHSSAILEALRKIYGATELVNELSIVN